jgi:hypothetical protein
MLSDDAPLFMKERFNPCVTYSFQSSNKYASAFTRSENVFRWIKPPPTPLLLSTFADLTRGKSELLAENALLRQQLIILRRQIKRPVYRKTDQVLLVLLARMLRTWKHTLFIVQPEIIIDLKSRKVIHVNVTRSPTDPWVAQQLREATPYGERPRYLIRDNDRKFGPNFTRVTTTSGIKVLRTPYRTPRANAICERGSVATMMPVL